MDKVENKHFSDKTLNYLKEDSTGPIQSVPTVMKKDYSLSNPMIKTITVLDVDKVEESVKCLGRYYQQYAVKFKTKIEYICEEYNTAESGRVLTGGAAGISYQNGFNRLSDDTNRLAEVMENVMRKSESVLTLAYRYSMKQIDDGIQELEKAKYVVASKLLDLRNQLSGLQNSFYNNAWVDDSSATDFTSQQEEYKLNIGKCEKILNLLTKDMLMMSSIREELYLKMESGSGNGIVPGILRGVGDLL